MHPRFVPRCALILTLIVLALPAAPARAGDPAIKPEVWIGGGVSYPDYHDVAETCGRGGIGAVFVEHLTLGASAQADRDHFHYFGDAGVILPQVWLFAPYGRYQFGRRDDRDENAWGWCAGLRLVGDGVCVYFEVNEILEPEFNKGLTMGIWF